MTPKSKNNLFAIAYFSFPFLTLGLIIYLSPKRVVEQPQIKPCNCLTYYEWQLLSTKRDMLLGKRKRSQNDKDSLVVYDRLLGIDETQDLYPDR